ncbi:MAG: YARHG domain-containing protein [Hyphomicrobiales bacterium]|nr:YARHG domain-containing protein [Hyphomicrobiales bacterium]
MLKLINVAVARSFILSMLTLLMTIAPQSAQAQSLQGMSCDDLWYARNQIYADKGFCFKTQRARVAFGAGCFSPFGQLNSYEQARVSRIKQQEQQMNCVAGGEAATPPQTSIYATMGCSALWYERNAIFARNGHCFKSARGQAQFGVGCFAPYGRLGSADQREVDQILMWEGRNGCR